jgi:hypothetical protein
LTRKQAKGKKKGGVEEESLEATELLKRPKEYTVKFTFPNPPSLSPPILGLHSEFSLSLSSSSLSLCISLLILRSVSGVDFAFEGHKPLFKNVDFGIDMETRSMEKLFLFENLGHVISLHTIPDSSLSLFSLYSWTQWSREEYSTTTSHWQVKSSEFASKQK